MIQLRPNYSPAARSQRCSICGSPQRPVDPVNPAGPREQTIDLGVFIEFEGEFEICEHCGIDIARVIGWIDPAEHDQLQKAFQKRVEAQDYLVDQVESARSSVDVLTREMAFQAHRVVTADADAVEAMIVAVEPDFG